MLEGMAKGNIHVAGGEEGDRFALSVGSEQTRERQEELLRQLENKRRQRAVAVTTDDKEVRKQLRALGEPITLFGEGPGDRRDRLRQHLADLDAADGGALPVPEEAEVVEEAAVQAELFYTEGSANLARARAAIAAHSLPRAAARVALAKRRREDPAVDEIAELDAAAAASARLETEASQIGDERPISVVRFSPGDGGGLILSAGWSGVMRLWRAEGCEKMTTVRAHEDRCTGADFHPCARVFEAADAAKTKLWRWRRGARMGSRTCGAPGGNIFARYAATPIDWVGWRFIPPGITSPPPTGTWRLWSVETGEELLCQEGHSRAVYDLGFHPDGSLAASVGLEAHGRVWDLRTGRCVQTLVGHVKQCLCVDFSPNGYQLVTGSDDHTARVWDLRKRGSIYTVPAHSKLISSVRYEPEFGGYFVTSSYDGAVKCWSARDFSCVNALRGHEARVMCADGAAGGETCASVGFDRTLKLWKRRGGRGGMELDANVDMEV